MTGSWACPVKARTIHCPCQELLAQVRPRWLSSSHGPNRASVPRGRVGEAHGGVIDGLPLRRKSVRPAQSEKRVHRGEAAFGRGEGCKASTSTTRTRAILRWKTHLQRGLKTTHFWVVLVGVPNKFRA